jgi:hypothetical protein
MKLKLFKWVKLLICLKNNNQQSAVYSSLYFIALKSEYNYKVKSIELLKVEANVTNEGTIIFNVLVSDR